MKIMDLQTPAKLYRRDATTTPYGGLTHVSTFIGRIWGDFQPDVPKSETTGENETYPLQSADYVCRGTAGLSRGDIVNLKGYDWEIKTLDEGADGFFRLRLERVHA
jgi:hypothetical protein